MRRKSKSVFGAAITLLFFGTLGNVWSAQYEPKDTNPPLLMSNASPDYLVSNASRVLNGPILSPYDNILGYTWYEYQHNNRMPRMVANDYQVSRGLHFTFMEMEEPPGNRYVDYNYWDYFGWTSVPPPSDRISEGPGRGGYTGMSVMRPAAGYFKPHSRAVIAHHYTEPVYPNYEEYHSVLVIEPWLPGQSAMAGGLYFYDIPDCVGGTEGLHGMWPSCAVDSANRVHVVMREGKSEAELAWLGYVRCYEIPDDSIVCESPGFPERRIAKETFYTDQDWEAAVFDSSALVSPIVVTSKVFNRVAICWVAPAVTLQDSSRSNLQNCNDIFYVESFDGGLDWMFAGTMPARINVTNYQAGDPYRAFGEISGLYDFYDSLHLFWVAQGYDQEENELDPNYITLWHWSKASERTCEADFYPGNKITQIGWETFPRGGAWNRGIAKIQSGIGIIDSTIDPYHYNKDYIYVQWTQFDDKDADPSLWNEAETFIQGDLYATMSTDFGFTWMSSVNLTNSSVDHCAAGDCASDHWSSMAERVDTAFYSQWIYDLDAGAYPQKEGVATDNPVLFKAFPVYTIPILSEARTGWSPAGWTEPPLHIPINGDTTVYLTLENIGTSALSISAITTTAGWLSIGAYPMSIQAGGCPAKVALTVSGENSCSFKVGSVRVQSNDQAGNHDISIPIHVVEDDNFNPAEFLVISNPTFHVSVSNTGNLGHQNDTAGMYLYTDLAEPEANFIFDASPAIGYVVPHDAEPSIVRNDTLVARYIFDDHYLVPATDLSLDTFFVTLDLEPIDAVQSVVVSKAEFWPVGIQIPPQEQYWPWWRIRVKNLVFHSNYPGSPPEGARNQEYVLLKIIQLFHATPPCWWASISPPSTYPITLLGMVLDIDCPSDSGAWNYPGYDQGRRMAWLRGYGAGAKENYGFAIAQKDTCYEFEESKFACWPVAPPPDDQHHAVHLLRNDALVYPQGGFRDDSLYKYMNTPGYSIYGDGIEQDYSIVTTGAVIDYHSTTDTFEIRYALVVTDQFWCEQLSTLVGGTACGNFNGDNTVGLSDIVYLINFVLKSGPAPASLCWAEINNDAILNLADVVYLINYLFRAGPPPMCSRFAFEQD